MKCPFQKTAASKYSGTCTCRGTGFIHPVTHISANVVRQQRHELIRKADSAALPGPFVTKQINGAQRVVASASTICHELEEVVAKLFDKDPLYGLELDNLG